MEFWMAYRFLKGNLLRALFPLIAVVVGTTALIMTISLGEGVRKIVENDLSIIGENRILVGGNRLTNKDLEIVERLPFVEYGMFPNKRKQIKELVYLGYSNKALLAKGIKVLRDNEVALDSNQFLGVKVGEGIELETRIGKRKFIIGDLYQEESPFETMKVGKRVVVSDKTFDQIFGRNNYKSLVISFPQDETGGEYIPIVLRELNRARFNYNQVRILETPDVYKKVERIKDLVNKGLFILSFISLTVGGLGILNLIASSIRERGSYIGILRTYGTTKERLILIFLTEAVVVMLVGSILGSLVGFVASYVVGQIIDIKPFYDILKILVSLSFTMIFGTLFGIYPLKKIWRIEIVEALKM